MDAVILAAGRGERLAGVAAPFHKPLMLVNGQPLIVRLVIQTLDHDLQPIIVAAPANIEPIVELLDASIVDVDVVLFVIQPRPIGPGDALQRGLICVRSDYVMVLMGDNIVTDDDFKQFLNHQVPAVGIATVDTLREADRFTVALPDRQGFVEHEPEKVRPWPDGKYHVWCGPFIDKAKALEVRLTTTIGQHLDPDSELVEMDVVDVGIPEALR